MTRFTVSSKLVHDAKVGRLVCAAETEEDAELIAKMLEYAYDRVRPGHAVGCPGCLGAYDE